MMPRFTPPRWACLDLREFSGLANVSRVGGSPAAREGKRLFREEKVPFLNNMARWGMRLK